MKYVVASLREVISSLVKQAQVTGGCFVGIDGEKPESKGAAYAAPLLSGIR
jgi:hypothetical protein